MTDDTHAAKPTSHHKPAEAAPLDLNEHGANGQTLDKRLFMQLLVLRHAPGQPVNLDTLSQQLNDAQVSAVVYRDVNHPRGLGLLTWAQDPAHFVTRVRPLLEQSALSSCTLRPEFTMLGRTYSSGYEQDLPYWLLQRPTDTVLNEAWPWAIWYPLRRRGTFAQLDRKEQGAILREHGTIGRAYGGQDLAHDVRLACHGLDTHDNEFVIGLVGKTLQPLSHVIQRMRSTRQTAEYIEQMGPFFVGHAARQVGAK